MHSLFSVSIQVLWLSTALNLGYHWPRLLRSDFCIVTQVMAGKRCESFLPQEDGAWPFFCYVFLPDRKQWIRILLVVLSVHFVLPWYNPSQLVDWVENIKYPSVIIFMSDVTFVVDWTLKTNERLC